MSPHVSLEEITAHYEALNQKYNPAFNTEPENLVKFKRIQEAFDCLKAFQCRVQYKKFGSYISSLTTSGASGESKEDQKGRGDPMQTMDIRMFTAIAFYFTFALLAAAMTTPEVRNLPNFHCYSKKMGYAMHWLWQ